MMRNLKEYPITFDEMQNFLDELAKEYNPEKTGLVGDIRPVMISELKDALPLWDLARQTETKARYNILIWHDGPQLVHYPMEEILAVAIPFDTVSKKFGFSEGSYLMFGTEISDGVFRDYLSGMRDLRSTLLASNRHIIFDIDRENVIAVSKIEEDWLPTAGFFHKNN
jgi:hypothetical protein